MASKKEPESPPETDCADLLKSLSIRLQPKQQSIYDAITVIGDVPTVLGIGGSRGAAKSGGIRRIGIQLACSFPGTRIYIVRRVLGDLLLNHVDEMKVEFPIVHKFYHAPSGGKRPEYTFSNGSRIILIYCETRADVDRLVKGQQAAIILIDQAEQFYEDELIAFREVNRAPGVPEGFCKLALFFNTAQGVGAEYLRRVFHTKRYRKNENPRTYWFQQVYGWDNFAWFENQVPYTFEEFYQLSSDERFAIYVRDTSQGRKQNELSTKKRDADLLGNFDSFDGQYFSTVWGSHCEIPAVVADELIQPWWTRWMSQKWGFGDYACHLWAAAGVVTPAQWRRVFGGIAAVPIEVVLIYRELLDAEGGLVLGSAEADMANDIVSMTPETERRNISMFLLGSPSLEQSKKRGENSVGESLGKILRKSGLPEPIPADERRVDGWRFMYACMRQAALRDQPTISAKQAQEGPMLLVSSACQVCIEKIPQAAQDPRNPDDIIVMPGEWPAVADAVRFLLKSKPAAKTQAPLAVRRQMALDAHTDPTSRHMAALQFNQKEINRGRASRAPNWRQ